MTTPTEKPRDRLRLSLVIAALLAALVTWPMGLLGMFFLFFGDAPRCGPDPRASMTLVFAALLLTVSSFAVIAASIALRRHPLLAAGAILIGSPWFALSLLLIGIELYHRLAGHTRAPRRCQIVEPQRGTAVANSVVVFYPVRSA